MFHMEPFRHCRLTQFQTHLLTVPRRINLPEALVTGRAVLAVRGVLIACSIVPGRPDCVLGLTNPVIGRPDCVMGLDLEKNIRCLLLYQITSIVKLQGIKQAMCGTHYLTAGVGPPP